MRWWRWRSGAGSDKQTTTQENQIETATKQKDLEYKTKEAADLDKSIAEASSDRATVQEQHAAVVDYLAQLGNTCSTKAETYEARAAHRAAEIELRRHTRTSRASPSSSARPAARPATFSWSAAREWRLRCELRLCDAAVVSARTKLQYAFKVCVGGSIYGSVVVTRIS